MPKDTPRDGTHLERYARLLRCAEINSSFYRPHARATYERWAASTPADFRFAVKMPRDITHDRRLIGTRAVLDRFLDESAGLGPRRGPLLLQLPPSFAYAARTAGRFLSLLRASYEGAVVVEPRHPSWFSAAADALLTSHGAGRVGAERRFRMPGTCSANCVRLDAPDVWPSRRAHRSRRWSAVCHA